MVKEVTIGDVRVCVRRWGSGEGKPVLYWHGGGGGSEEAPVLGTALAAAGHTMHALDAPGYGDSPALERDRYRPSALAALGAGLIEALDLAPAVWIGFSWGGAVGMHTAVRYPETVRALCLLDGGYLVAADDPDHDPAAGFEQEVEELRRRSAEGESWDASPEVIAAAIAGSRDEPTPPLFPRLRSLPIPVLLAHATDPPELEAVRAQALRRFRNGLPSAHVVPIAGAGHDLFVDKPTEVGRVVVGWLAELA